jgi:hypothetical protein
MLSFSAACTNGTLAPAAHIKYSWSHACINSACGATLLEAPGADQVAAMDRAS